MTQIAEKYFGYSHFTKTRDSNSSLPWALWFTLCLIPFSLPGGYSANYLFVFTPLIYTLGGGKIFFLTKLLNLFFVVCVVIFFVAAVYQLQFYEQFVRRSISFILFMSIFTLAVIDFSRRMINSFLLAVVVVSVCFSLNAISMVVISGVVDPATLKVIVGSQRIGFLYLFALWILLGVILDQYAVHRFRLLSLVCFAIVLIGLIFTFSRSSYVALAAGIFFVGGFYLLRSRFKVRWLKSFFYVVILFSWALVAILSWFPQFFSFLDQRLFILFSSEILLGRLTSAESSEGARIAIWALVGDFVLRNPLTGSGFLGSWVLSDWSGSSHNDFVDRFLRLGVIGFTLYMLILFRLYKFLIHFHPSLAFGFVSILFYSLFHETFGLSQGSVILSFLLMLYARHYRQSRRASQNENHAHSSFIYVSK